MSETNSGHFEPANPDHGNIWQRLNLPQEQGLSLVQAVEEGMAVDVLDALGREIQTSQQRLLALTGISERTLARRRSTGRLSAGESDRVARLATVMAAAENLFEGDTDGARQWLDSPARALGGIRPLDLLKTEAGGREVLNLIGRLEHGVFS